MTDAAPFGPQQIIQETETDAPTSVIAVHTDGSVYASTPHLAAIDRKRKAVATFTAKQAPPSHADIVDRLRNGLRKEFL